MPHSVHVVMLFFVRLLAIVWLLGSMLNVSGDNLLVGLFLTAGVSGLLAASLLRWVLLLLTANPEAVSPEPGLRVAVVTTFVPRAESLGMLEQTLIAMTNLDYPHDTWVLDEGDNKDVIAICGRVGANHFSRKNRPEYQTDAGVFQRATKHGNYNAWLHEVGFNRYDILAGIDPDQVAARDFLSATLGHFRDPKVAYVQSPQEYYNADSSFIARGCDEESRDFYWITQRAYHRFGNPSVIGAHNIHRMRALESVGGLAPHVTDDLLLTLYYQVAGWRGVYVDRVLARGLAPVDWTSYIRQQRRWARSLLDMKLRVYPRVCSKMSLMARAAGFVQGLTYVQDGIIAICFLIALVGALLMGVPQRVALLLTSPTVLLCIAFLTVSGLYPHLHHSPNVHKGFYWRSAWLRFAKWPFTLHAVWEVARGGNHKYDLTLKAGPRTVQLLLFWPHLVISVVLAFLSTARFRMHGPTQFLPQFCAALFVLASVVLAIANLLPAPPAFQLGIVPAKCKRHG